MAQEAVPESRFVHSSRTEGVNLLHREHAVIDIYEGAEAGQAGRHAEVRSSECAEERRMREEELAGYEVIRVYVVIDIRIELPFVEGGECSSCDSAARGLRSRNEKLAIRELEIKQLQGNGIDR